MSKKHFCAARQKHMFCRKVHPRITSTTNYMYVYVKYSCCYIYPVPDTMLIVVPCTKVSISFPVQWQMGLQPSVYYTIDEKVTLKTLRQYFVTIDSDTIVYPRTEYIR